MSYFAEYGHPCAIMEKRRVEDGAGGWTTEWTQGAEFTNYQGRKSSVEALRAEQEGVTSLYTGLVQKDVPIEYGDYYKDLETGTTYRVTSRPEERVTPSSASMQLKAFSAERKELPQ